MTENSLEICSAIEAEIAAISKGRMGTISPAEVKLQKPGEM
jgi:hypothetical protein